MKDLKGLLRAAEAEGMRALYGALYANPEFGYRMGDRRIAHARAMLDVMSSRGHDTLLDVGTGRGEMLDMAAAAGFVVAHGVEIVPELCTGHGECIHAAELPRRLRRWCGAGEGPVEHLGADRVVALIDTVADLSGLEDCSYDLVTCYDVMEHIRPEETDAALAELLRVTRQTLCVNIYRTKDSRPGGVELHINLKPIEQWFDAAKRAELPDPVLIHCTPNDFTFCFEV